MEETGVPATDKLKLLHNVASSTPCHEWGLKSQL
jgi:hypothetical protein